MKYLLLLMVTTSSIAGYIFWQTDDELEPKAFQKAIYKSKNALLLDVRTPYEFSNGHIPGAMNVDWSSPVFNSRIAELDTEKLIFLYCKTGGLSSKATVYLRSHGFSYVNELRGGLTAWHAEALPETPAELIPPDKMTLMEFSWVLDLEHDVLVDFYIPGNTNCQKMEPVIDELAIEYEGNIKIMRVNIENYKHLATELGIEETPVLQFYENGNLTFQWKGITEYSLIKKQLSTYSQPLTVVF